MFATVFSVHVFNLENETTKGVINIVILGSLIFKDIDVIT